MHGSMHIPDIAFPHLSLFDSVPLSDSVEHGWTGNHLFLKTNRVNVPSTYDLGALGELHAFSWRYSGLVVQHSDMISLIYKRTLDESILGIAGMKTVEERPPSALRSCGCAVPSCVTLSGSCGSKDGMLV